MNKCIDPESMIAFAINPATSENAETAAHLISCERCREEYHLARQVVATDNVIPTQADIMDAEAATTRLLSKRQWDKLNDLAETIKHKLDAAIGGFTARFATKMLFAPSDGGMVFAASDQKKPGGNEQVPMLTFESTAAPCFKEYWKLNLYFPATVSKTSLLTLKVYDAGGNALPSGQILFQGRTLEVTAGIAVLSLADFLAGARIPKVAYRFPDGTVSEGVIKFMPDVTHD